MVRLQATRIDRRTTVATLSVMLVVLGVSFSPVGTTTVAAQPPEAAQDGFVPMDDIPLEDQL
ncbi:MAG: hypothetical protein QF681_15550, partial [Vicinamibacterales bacterium]|nr:hypothetical protein [Vicinamibacterales bacterium]